MIVTDITIFYFDVVLRLQVQHNFQGEQSTPEELGIVLIDGGHALGPQFDIYGIRIVPDTKIRIVILGSFNSIVEELLKYIFSSCLPRKWPLFDRELSLTKVFSHFQAEHYYSEFG